MLDCSAEKMQPTRVAMKERLAEVRDAASRLQHALRHTPTREFLEVRRIVIAAGARPVPLDFPGAEHAITSDAFIELEDLPKRIVMVGGGYIAAEFPRGCEGGRAAKSGAHAYAL